MKKLALMAVVALVATPVMAVNPYADCTDVDVTVNIDALTELWSNMGTGQERQGNPAPVLQITNALTDQTLSMGDLVRLLLIGMEEGRRDARQGDRAFGINDAWKVLDLVGFRGVLVAVFDALAQVLSYSPEADDQEADDSPPEG